MERFLQWMLKLVPLLLPMALVRAQLGSIPFSALEIVIDVLFVVWAGFLLFRGRFVREVLKPLVQWGSLPQLLLLFFVATAITWVAVPSEVIFNTGIKEHLYETYETRRIWLGIMKGWMLPLLLYGMMLHSALKDRQTRDDFIAWSVVGAVALSLACLFVRYALGWPDTLDGRLGGLYVSANYLVFLVAPAFVWAMGQLIRWWGGKHDAPRWHLHLAWAALVPLALALILARSYASWIVLIVLGAICVARWLRGRKLIAVCVLAVLMVGGLLMTEAGSEKLIGFVTTDKQSSTSTRVEVYTISMELLKRHWLVGIGPGQYESQYITNAHDILGKTPYEWVMLHPHNLYLSVWLSTGLLGLIAFLGMIIQALRGAWKERSLLVLLPLAYILLHGIVDTPFWKLDSMLLFVLLAAVCFPRKMDQ